MRRGGRDQPRVPAGPGQSSLESGRGQQGAGGLLSGRVYWASWRSLCPRLGRVLFGQLTLGDWDIASPELSGSGVHKSWPSL